MHLKPYNYSFRLHASKVLGFMLTKRGMKENPDKCQAIINMISPSNVKEVQQPKLCLDDLACFLPCGGDKVFHFFPL